jgi:hypothetical protein
MAVIGFPLQAYLVVDNSVLVMLNDFCCDQWGAKVPPGQLPARIGDWMCKRLDVLRQFALDGSIHCTDGVANEFIPGAGRMGELRGIRRGDCTWLANQIRAMLEQSSVAADDIAFLRNLPGAPRDLVRQDRLSDHDLSLIVLGARLSRAGGPVYVLSNDKDLLHFISWLRPTREARACWPCINLLQGLMGLSYLESVHRNCKIRSEEMESLIGFSFREHYERTNLAGTSKGRSILMDLLAVNGSFMKSVAIKNSVGFQPALGGAPA